MDTNIGVKDHHKELFQMWTSVFQIPRTFKHDATVAGSSCPSSTSELRFKYVIDSVHMSNEYEKLMQGVFENYLHQRMPANQMDGVAEALTWFTFNDQVQSQINKEQCYSTFKYLPFAFASWHFSFANISWPKINYPNKSYEVHQKLKATKYVLDILSRNINVATRGVGTSTTCIHLNSLIYVRLIISPQLRSVSLQLLTPMERSNVEQTVEIMLDMGLSYIQLKASDGTNQFNLDPNIDFLFQLTENSIPVTSTWCKQLLAREVELAKIHRNQVKIAKTNSNDKKNKSKGVEDSRQNQANVPNFLVRLQVKSLSPSKRQQEVTRKDFFGRIEKIPAEQLKKEHSTASSIIKGSIWYCYKEGFNNAVRKNVKMADLM